MWYRRADEVDICGEVGRVYFYCSSWTREPEVMLCWHDGEWWAIIRQCLVTKLPCSFQDLGWAFVMLPIALTLVPWVFHLDFNWWEVTIHTLCTNSRVASWFSSCVWVCVCVCMFVAIRSTLKPKAVRGPDLKVRDERTCLNHASLFVCVSPSQFLCASISLCFSLSLSLSYCSPTSPPLSHFCLFSSPSHDILLYNYLGTRRVKPADVFLSLSFPPQVWSALRIKVQQHWKHWADIPLTGRVLILLINIIGVNNWKLKSAT